MPHLNVIYCDKVGCLVKQGYTQDDMARRLNIHQWTVCRIVKGVQHQEMIKLRNKLLKTRQVVVSIKTIIRRFKEAGLY